MDVLSEVLSVLRLSGVIHFRAEFTEPWAFITSPPEMLATRFNIRTGTVTPFHIATNGECWVTSGNLPPTNLAAGDVVMFPRADQHIMASRPGVSPAPISQILPEITKEHVAELRYGGGGKCARFVCGYLQSDQQFDPLLKALPKVICIRAREGALTLETLDHGGRRVQPIDQQREVDWWHASVRYLISEADVPGPGNRAALARLAESLFVEVLRWQFRYATADSGGWLAGLQDHQIGRVINLLHALPDRPWTVDELAKEVAMSRSALAKRFVELVGESPMQYLASWRMHLARHLLREGTLDIGEIAGRVGYDSDAAFNRAFRRLVGLPPAAWRESNYAAAGFNGSNSTVR